MQNTEVICFSSISRKSQLSRKRWCELLLAGIQTNATGCFFLASAEYCIKLKVFQLLGTSLCPAISCVFTGCCMSEWEFRLDHRNGVMFTFKAAITWQTFFCGLRWIIAHWNWCRSLHECMTVLSDFQREESCLYTISPKRHPDTTFAPLETRSAMLPATSPFQSCHVRETSRLQPVDSVIPLNTLYNNVS